MTQKLTLTVASFIAIAVTNCKGFQQPLLKRLKVGFFFIRVSQENKEVDPANNYSIFSFTRI